MSFGCSDDGPEEKHFTRLRPIILPAVSNRGPDNIGFGRDRLDECLDQHGRVSGECALNRISIFLTIPVNAISVFVCVCVCICV